MTATCSVTEISRYFDRLVDLIPSKHYFHADDAVNLKYLKRAERDTTKAAYKQAHKSNKRARFDPDADVSTTKLQKQNKAADAGDDEPSTSDATAPSALHANLTSSASREELQKRLQAKVTKLRGERKADEQAKSAEGAKAWRAKQLAASNKPSKADRKKHAKAKAAQGDAKAGAPAPATSAVDSAAAALAQVDTSDVMFNTLKVADVPASQKRGAKKQTKQQMLQAAEEHAAAAAALAATPDGQAQLEGKSWDKLTKMAKGERILDNPALLKRSIKRDAKHKEKKSELWKNRVNDQKQKMAQVQKKRTGNLQKRIDEKKDKKIKKRENKLMRAGFEGRKSGTI